MWIFCYILLWETTVTFLRSDWLIFKRHSIAITLLPKAWQKPENQLVHPTECMLHTAKPCSPRTRRPQLYGEILRDLLETLFGCSSPGRVTGSPSSEYEHRRASALLRNIQNKRICMGKKAIVSVAYENERISIKSSLPYLKCVLRLSCVVDGPIYGRFMGFYVNGSLYIKVNLYWNPFIFVGYGNDRFFPHTNPYILNAVRNNAYAHISSLGYLWSHAAHFPLKRP